MADCPHGYERILNSHRTAFGLEPCYEKDVEARVPAVNDRADWD